MKGDQALRQICLQFLRPFILDLIPARIQTLGAIRRVSSAITSLNLTAGLGLEPRYSAPEADVLPLDDPANMRESPAVASEYPKTNAHTTRSTACFLGTPLS